jgi:hypothetical protein
MARLVARARDGLSFEVGTGVTSIGRGADADVQIDDQAVSRAHARIEYESGLWRIVDLGSTNGTRVDTRQLRPWQPQILDHGVVVDVGGAVLFDFELDESERVRSGPGSEPTRPSVGRTAMRLTPTESEVLELLFVHYDEGRAAPRLATLKEIAARRFTTTAAVKMVLQGLYDKFGLQADERNKEQLALRAQRQSMTRARY